MGCSASKHLDKRVVIVGGGFAGTTIAKALDDTFEVVLIERREAMVHAFSQLRASVNPEYGKDTLLPYDKLLKRGKVVRANVTEILPDRVRLEGEPDIVVREEDFLVIATGSSMSAPCTPAGLTVAEMRHSHREVHDAIEAAGHVVIVGGGPVGVELAGEIRDAWETEAEKRITIVHRGPYLCSSSRGRSGEIDIPESFGVKLAEVVRSRGIDVRTGVSVTVPAAGGPPPTGLVSAPGPLALSDGSSIDDADLAIWVTGPRPHEASPYAAAFASAVDSAGRLRVNGHLQVEGHGNVFAVGDCAECGAPKMGYFAAKVLGPLAARNIQALADGKTKLGTFTPGAPAMLVPVGAKHGRAVLPLCGSMQAGSGMVSSVKGKELFLPVDRKAFNLE